MSPSSMSSWKWIPPYSLDAAAELAASVNVANGMDRLCAGTAPGSRDELPRGKEITRPKLSLPRNRFSASAAAALNTLCPDGYDGNGGVTKVGDWNVPKFWPSIVTVP